MKERGEFMARPRNGWRALDWRTCEDHWGRRWQLDQTCPRTIGWLVYGPTEDRAAHQWPIGWHGILPEPLQGLVWTPLRRRARRG